MKYIINVVLGLLLAGIMVGPAQAQMKSTGARTGDSLINSGITLFGGIIVVTDGTNAVTVEIYDNTSAAGAKLIPTWVVTTSATQRSASIGFGAPIKCMNGIYVDITTSGTVEYTVYYMGQ